ncbi:hypothetical protein A0H81_05606 [Grifola frondosa]|uniref:Uncharacterized protein n=1 Tax=Grifola frondosa TaxID=5627 RepID=A0A1C7ME57_GRIFR|nr:hypothetical protein A0H81_05606 [Grifola frondosa]
MNLYPSVEEERDGICATAMQLLEDSARWTRCAVSCTPSFTSEFLHPRASSESRISLYPLFAPSWVSSRSHAALIPRCGVRHILCILHLPLATHGPAQDSSGAHDDPAWQMLATGSVNAAYLAIDYCFALYAGVRPTATLTDSGHADVRDAHALSAEARTTCLRDGHSQSALQRGRPVPTPSRLLALKSIPPLCASALLESSSVLPSVSLTPHHTPDPGSHCLEAPQNGSLSFESSHSLVAPSTRAGRETVQEHLVCPSCTIGRLVFDAVPASRAFPAPGAARVLKLSPT